MAKSGEAARDNKRAPAPRGTGNRRPWATTKAAIDKEVDMVEKIQDDIKELEMMAVHETQDAQEAREAATLDSLPPEVRENVEVFYRLLTERAEQTAALYRDTAQRLNDVMKGTSEAVKLSVKAFAPLMKSFTENAEKLQEAAEMWRVLGPYMDAEAKEHPEIYGDDEHPDVGEDVPLETLIAAAAKRARAAGVDVPMLKAEEAAMELLAKSVIFAPGDHALTFSGDALSILSKARTRGSVDRYGSVLTINDFFINAETAKGIGVGEAKLLRYGASAFTKVNGPNSKNLKLRVYADTKEFARICRIPIDRKVMQTPEEQSKEDRRAVKALDNFVLKLAKNAKNLTNASFNWTERVQGKSRSYNTLNMLGRSKISRDTIMLEFTQSAAEYMVRLPLIEVPSAYYAIDDKKTNAFAIADALIIHYNIDNNIVRNTERILKVETLLKHTSFPTIEEIRGREKRTTSWVNLVKEPFEAAMDELYQKGLIAPEEHDPKTGKRISGGWRYSLSGMTPLSDEEASLIIKKGYAYFTSLYVVFELAGYEPHEVRAKAIAEKKALALAEYEKRTGKRPARKSAKKSTKKTETETA